MRIKKFEKKNFSLKFFSQFFRKSSYLKCLFHCQNLLTLNFVGLSTAPSSSTPTATSSGSIGIMGLTCHISHELCLSMDDLLYLLETRRESMATEGFLSLYPSLAAIDQQSLIDELNNDNNNQSPISVFSDGLVMSDPGHATADLHPLLMNLERFYYRHLINAASAGNGQGGAPGGTMDDESSANNHAEPMRSGPGLKGSSSMMGCSDGKPISL